jgi:hypothetical protein
MLGCIDCHGENKKFVKYHFEAIDSEYQKSVHALKIDNFSCWKCHNAHEYINVYLSTQNIKSTISVANRACLSCHEDVENYNLYSTKKMKNISMEHDWLPNQDLHFKSVRCIDCHSKLNDSIATPHFISTVDNAVKNCTECHSDESRLVASLYKFKMRDNRKTYGFINAAIINDAYVVGANRNHFLNIASIVVFSIVVLAILVHIFLRIIFNKNRKIHG